MGFRWLWALVFTLLAGTAWGHSWYEPECCTVDDCAPYKGEVTETDGGYKLADGRFIAYTDKRVRVSADKDFHVCAGVMSGYIFCLYVPGRGV